jgi:Zn-dependent protease with chaperone function
VPDALTWPVPGAALGAALESARPLAIYALLAWIVPQLSAHGLARALLGPADARARAVEDPVALAPYRKAALVVGILQVQAAWAAGVARVTSPALEAATEGWASVAFGAALATTAFVSGGVGRARVEQPSLPRRAAALARLRLVPFVGAPVAVALAAAALPVVEMRVDPDGVSRAGVSLPWLLGALAVTGVGVAYGGLLGALALGALRPASRAVAALARAAAAAEGVRLWVVLRWPTRGLRLANAAALPWARTLIVTDRLTELLPERELRAVLAHEAAHLSEPPAVALARLGAATLALFALATAASVWAVTGDPRAGLGCGALLAAAALAFVGARQVARRMEERADAHARARTGAEALGSALRALHADLRLPMTTGARRVHPDLYDRLAACGMAPAERPAPPPRTRKPALLALAFATGVGVAVALADLATALDVSAARAGDEPAATRRLALDARDPLAWLARAWAARRRGDLDAAWSHGDAARLAGLDAVEHEFLRSELLAADGRCDDAEEAYRRALARHAAETLAHDGALRLDALPAPPALLGRCE